MKYLMILMLCSWAISLFSESYIGEWKVNTMGDGNKANISQNKDEISVFRILQQNFEGEEYILYHLMKGNIKDKTLKLYVKEDDTDKFEYLRDVSFKKNTLTSLNIDGKTYTKIKNLDKKTDPTKLSNNDNEGKVEIIYLNKDKNKENNKKDLYTNNSKDKNIEDENLDTDLSVILPSGLGERGNKVIKISQGFSDKEKSLNSKAMRLMRRKNYNKAVKIFLDLYSNNNKNISLLIKIEQVYSITGNKTEANKYCKKIKKYDPFYLCGG